MLGGFRDQPESYYIGESCNLAGRLLQHRIRYNDPRIRMVFLMEHTIVRERRFYECRFIATALRLGILLLNGGGLGISQNYPTRGIDSLDVEIARLKRAVSILRNGQDLEAHKVAPEAAWREQGRAA
jgi:hypothetical protein